MVTELLQQSGFHTSHLQPVHAQGMRCDVSDSSLDDYDLATPRNPHLQARPLPAPHYSMSCCPYRGSQPRGSQPGVIGHGERRAAPRAARRTTETPSLPNGYLAP